MGVASPLGSSYFDPAGPNLARPGGGRSTRRTVRAVTGKVWGAGPWASLLRPHSHPGSGRQGLRPAPGQSESRARGGGLQSCKELAAAVGRAGQGAIGRGQGHWSLRVPAREAPRALPPLPAGLPGAAEAGPGGSRCERRVSLPPPAPASLPPLSLPPPLRPPPHPAPFSAPQVSLARERQAGRRRAEQAAQRARPPPARRSSPRPL